MLLTIGFVPFTVSSLVFSLFPIFFNQYWFVTIYLILLVLSPYINVMIEHISKKHYLNLILILFFIDSIWQSIYIIENIGVHYGLSLVHFLFLYLVSAYIGKYGFVMKDFSKVVYLAGFTLFVFITAASSYILSGSIGRLFSYNSPLVVLSAYCLFLFFKKLSFQSNLINKVSTYTFGVYLVHEHFLLRPIIWEDIGIIEQVLNGSESLFAVKLIVFSVFVFAVCWLLSYVLTTIFNRTLNCFGNNLKSKKLQRKSSALKIQ